MNTSLSTIDNAFTSQYRSLLDIQRNIKHQLETYPFDLSKTEITNVIIERMYAFWFFNVKNNKEILNRDINTTAADFFTESCLLYFKSYFEQRGGFTVFSEKKIYQSNIRPDISIWKDSRLVAVIELKVSDGWKGKSMLPHLQEREQQIKNLEPTAHFSVLAFWNFFDVSDSNWNSRYFGLLNFDKSNNHARTNASVEKLIQEINKNL